MDNYLIPVIPFHKQIISKGKGSYIFDENGKKYLDLNCGQFCTIFGHSNPELVKCVTSISKTISHTSSGMISDLVLKAASKLNEISGELDARSILLSTGAEAVEFAIRYAKHMTGKDGLVCFEKGYHGLTLGTQSITFGGRYAAPFVNHIFSIPIPTGTDDINGIDVLKKIIAEHKEVIAAVVVEPIVSVGGMIYPDRTYFTELYNICKRNGMLLIFDESQTGFGRTGSWFCYQEFHLIPDMVVCSKGMGLGYPVSAVLFNGELCAKNKITMTHYSSHQNDPFAAGIISFGIDYIQKNDLLHSNRKKGRYFLKRLISVCEKNNLFVNPRGQGLMLGLDMCIPGVENYRPIYRKLYDMAAEKGVLLQGTDGGRVLRFLPDYLISYEDIDFCTEVLGGIICSA
ncbi:MAG: aspartate aminotransferase family protein [Lachnospiraceae bacterium]|nr:aspartate aminotransferase family protein [Lachnospiraceae bacterium]